MAAMKFALHLNLMQFPEIRAKAVNVGGSQETQKSLKYLQE